MCKMDGKGDYKLKGESLLLKKYHGLKNDEDEVVLDPG